jgi:Protein of unknown function (DUF1643)
MTVPLGQLDLTALEGVLPAVQRRRVKPIKPVKRWAVFHDDIEVGRWREILMHIWGPGPKLTWICFHPDLANSNILDLPTDRMMRWTYQLGYDGFLVAAIYPLRPLTRLSPKGAVAWRNNHPGAGPIMAEAATKAGQHSARHHCTDVVVATGQMFGETERQDFEEWIESFRIARRRHRTNWLCLGVNKFGWPNAPALHGTTSPGKEIVLKPWKLPINNSYRRYSYGKKKPAVNADGTA